MHQKDSDFVVVPLLDRRLSTQAQQALLLGRAVLDEPVVRSIQDEQTSRREERGQRIETKDS